MKLAATLEPVITIGDDAWQKARRSLTLWHFPGGKPRQLPIKQPLHCMAFSPDGKLIVGGLARGFFDEDFDILKEETGIVVWQPNEKQDAITLRGHRKAVVGVAFIDSVIDYAL